MPFRRPLDPQEDPSGITGEISKLFTEAGVYLATRAELLAIESQEAGRILGARLVVLILAIGALMVAYLTGIAAAVFFLGRWLSTLGDSAFASWGGAAGVIGIVHLLIAFIFLKRLKQIGKNVTLFEFTRAECKKDQQWIRKEKNLS